MGWVGLGLNISGLGWIGLKKIDPWPTLESGLCDPLQVPVSAPAPSQLRVLRCDSANKNWR